eukprot:Nitzschia sp. Nitz4//scaffold10_size219509//72090//72806//NITZ4_001416-RA/size219509-processed-gene-0.232-mRNA-1//1//CDS//3329532884//1121//frame0
MSEFETDAANAEVSALDKLPWPADMKDQVWMERVRLRQHCKKSMGHYREFWKEHESGYVEWFKGLPAPKLRRLFQLPRTEIFEQIKSQKYQLLHAFGTVLCAAAEQVANFDITGYPPDGRGDAELDFESILSFDRRGGFTLKSLESEETRNIWLTRQKTLGGPKLLERNARKSDDDDEGGADDADDNVKTENGSATPSFRSDRRIVRLLIARHFAEVLERLYLKELGSSEDKKDEEKA